MIHETPEITNRVFSVETLFRKGYLRVVIATGKFRPCRNIEDRVLMS